VAVKDVKLTTSSSQVPIIFNRF